MWWSSDMQVETIHIIVTCISTLLGLIGGGVGLIYWRENKQLKAAEVSDKLVDVELKEANEWNRLYNEERERNKEKSVRLKALYNERDGLKEQLNKANFRIEQLQWYHCTVNGCRNRRPPHTFDDAGNEVIMN